MSPSPNLDELDLDQLDATVVAALTTQDESALKVLGYGEISTVIAWPLDEPKYACKRLPPFRDGKQLENYRSCLEEYLDVLQEAGIEIVPTTLEAVEGTSGLIGYCVQPAIAAKRLAPNYLSECDTAEAEHFVEQLIEHVLSSVSDQLGLDAQVSNWVVNDDGHLSYLDISTPLMRDRAGKERLDADLFLASLPWALRWMVHRFMLHGIIDKYHQPRGVLLDVLGNLHKEQLSELVPLFSERINVRLPSPITPKDVRSYYRGDARTWALLQRLRRWDRWWQRRIRRRTYPFLLPPRIERHV